VAPPGYNSKHIPSPDLLNHRPPAFPAAHILYWDGILDIQVEMNHAAGHKNAYFRQITAEIGLPGARMTGI